MLEYISHVIERLSMFGMHKTELKARTVQPGWLHIVRQRNERNLACFGKVNGRRLYGFFQHLPVYTKLLLHLFEFRWHGL